MKRKSEVEIRIHVGQKGYSGIVTYIAPDGERTKRVFRRENSGKDSMNKMGITSITQALEMLKQSCSIKIYTNCGFVKGAIRQRWPIKWLKNDWKKDSGEPIRNRSEWIYLFELLGKHDYTFEEDEDEKI